MLERVQKIIANSGYCSRRKAEELIEHGKVKVNGKTITIGDKAEAFNDKITVDGKLIKLERHEYFLFHKPLRCLTSFSDPSGKKTIKEYLKGHDRLKPVGRLDYMTEGALILTSDGDFANKIAHPRYEVKKTYRVYTDKPVTDAQVKKLNSGILVEDKRVRAHAKALTAHNNILDVTIHEGRNRIVRKMMEVLGVDIKQLVRIQIGPVKLANLPPGKLRKLTKEEIGFFQQDSKKPQQERSKLRNS